LLEATYTKKSRDPRTMRILSILIRPFLPKALRLKTCREATLRQASTVIRISYSPIRLEMDMP
jgi:hypothetical protein